jgi:flagellar biosynthetic protein FliO
MLALVLGAVLAFVWETACAAPLMHTVRSGDSLWLIAKRYGVSADDIARANSLRDARKIHAGLRLVIPQAADGHVSAVQDYGVAPAAGGAPSAGGGPPAAGERSDGPEPAASAYRTSASTREAAPDAPGGVQTAPLARTPAPAAPRPKASMSSPATGPAARHDRAAASITAAAGVDNRAAQASAPVETSAPAQTPQPREAPAAPPVLAASEATQSGGVSALAGLKSDGDLFSSSAKKNRGYGLMTVLDFALKLVLVLILAYLCMLALKRFSQRRAAGSGKGGALRVMDTIGLAPNRQLHIVALGDKAYLLGSTPESVSLIADVSETRGVDDLSGGGRGEKLDPAFSQRLKELMKAAPANRAMPSAMRTSTAGLGGRLAQATQFIKARSNQMRPLGEIIDETLSG